MNTVFDMIRLANTYNLKPFIDPHHSWYLQQTRGYWGYATQIPELDKRLDRCDSQSLRNGMNRTIDKRGIGGKITVIRESWLGIEYRRYIIFCPNRWYADGITGAFDFRTRKMYNAEDYQVPELEF